MVEQIYCFCNAGVAGYVKLKERQDADKKIKAVGNNSKERSFEHCGI